MRLLLNHQNGFPWGISTNLWVKGYAFAAGGQYLHEEDLLHHIRDELYGGRDLPELLKSLNGIYSVICTQEGNTYLFSDKSRFFPVFFRLAPEFIVSDEPENLILPGDAVNETAFDEFRYTGYVTSSDTLVSGIKQVPAGELLTIREDLTVTRIRLFSYRVRQTELRYDRDPVGEMAAAIEKAAGRFILSIGDATPVLPLSGGFDSRLIACLLKARGYNNTICFTYGRETAEVEISGRVARHLGFTWHYVNYETLPGNWLAAHDEEFQAYYRYTSRLTSMFYLQEFPAVLHLVRNGLIPKNSVFLPGHSGDLLGGSQFAKVFPECLRYSHIVNLLLRSKYANFPPQRLQADAFRARLNASLELKEEFLATSIFEDWDIREKIAKFIFNSSQVFVFFGFQVRFLFWDDELVEFFRRLPPALKNHKRIYNQCLQEKFFAVYGVNFSKELMPGPFSIWLQHIKDFIKPILPFRLQYKYMLKNDWACYEKFIGLMLEGIDEDTKNKLPHGGFNSILINWYLQQVKKRLSKPRSL
jgi:asparagine synthase (glutamine-hydrolysing)